MSAVAENLLLALGDGQAGQNDIFGVDLLFTVDGGGGLILARGSGWGGLGGEGGFFFFLFFFFDEVESERARVEMFLVLPKGSFEARFASFFFTNREMMPSSDDLDQSRTRSAKK